MTRLRTLALGLAGAATLGWMTALPASAADLTLRFAWTMPPHTATSDQAEAIAKNIEKMSNGSIKVQTYPAGSLSTETTMGQAIANNTVNMGILGMHWWSNQEPALEWDTIPFLVTDPGKLIPAFYGKLGNDVNDILAKHGVTIIGWGFYGYSVSYLNTKHEIKRPDDLKGLKMRSDGKLNNIFMKQNGASPVAIDSSEVYTALQRGTLDGGASGLASFVTRKWYEVGKFITPIKYCPIVYPIQANIKWWKGLTQDQRDTITKAIKATEEDNLKRIEEDQTNFLDVVKKAGLKVYMPTDEDLKVWKDKAQASAEKAYLAESGDKGKEMLSDVQDAMKQGASN